MMASSSRRRCTALLAPALLLLATAGAPRHARAQALVWTRTYDGGNTEDYGAAVGVGPDGSVYVAGRTGEWYDGNLFLRKYSADGAPLWTRTYDGADDRDEDWARGLAVDRWGNVYVAGQTWDAEHRQFLLLRKYSSAGTLLWSRTYRGASDAQGWDVAVAPDGTGVYVTGIAYAGFARGDDIILRKYSAQGAPLWTTFYNGTGSGYDEGHGVAVAPDGSVYVTGSTEVPGPAARLVLLKYAPSGVRQWVTLYGGPRSDFFLGGMGVAAGRDGSVYVTGDTYSATRQTDLLFQKYSKGGKLLWTKALDGESRLDRGDGVAVGPDGTVYVTGKVGTALESDNLILRRYSPWGGLRWQTIYNGDASGSDVGLGVAVGQDGSIYVSGRTSVPGQGWDLLLQKYQ
ncbi:MAG TPA: SBBP repeat-containing protein [bacterium]